MQFPEIIQRDLNELYEKHKDLAESKDDNDRRTLTKMVIEQAIFDCPNQGYCWKSSTPTNPPSKDMLAQDGPNGFIGWDLFNGDTRLPNQFPEHKDLKGQHVILVGPVNHLRRHSEPPPPPIDENGNNIPPVKVEVTTNDLLLQVIKNQQMQIDELRLLATATNAVLIGLQTDIKTGIKIRF